MEELERLIDEIVAISESLSKTHTGALIVFEREVGLNDYIDTGVAIEGLVSQELLGNIFIPNTPLHDGAVIIRETVLWQPAAPSVDRRSVLVDGIGDAAPGGYRHQRVDRCRHHRRQ